MCKQPANKDYGLGLGKSVGGIDLPMLTCNNIAADFRSGNIFKLYTDADDDRCGSYKRTGVSNACIDACNAQYTDCTNVYAKGCQVDGKVNGLSFGSGYFIFKRYAGSYFEIAQKDKRSSNRFSETYSSAASHCQAQLNDCKAANQNFQPASSKCSQFGSF